MALSASPFRVAPDDRPLGTPLNWVLAFAASTGLWTLIGAAIWRLVR